MKSSYKNRIVIEFDGVEKGPLLVIIAALHGNETAGLKAMQLVSKMLEVEPIKNPDFSFNGKMIGLIGNMKALHAGVRYLDEDLNRIWKVEKIDRIRNKAKGELNCEENELLDILTTILLHIQGSQATELYILDLHTTSSSGGIFSIPNDDPRSLSIAKNLHAPVIVEMLKGVSGSTLHYFNNENFPGINTTAVTFEAGQHEDITSVNRCIAAIVNCMRSIGIVRQDDVETIHDRVLQLYSEDLPTMSRLVYKHSILPGDGFKMKAGFKNFDQVFKGQVLAEDTTGDITAKSDGLILMPLYQPQGAEGFYIIQVVNDREETSVLKTKHHV